MRGAEFIRQLIATHTMASLQGTRRIVQAGVDDATVTRTCTHSNLWKGLEDEYRAPALRKGSCDCAADDSTADDHYVCLFHGLQFSWTAAGLLASFHSKHAEVKLQIRVALLYLQRTVFRGCAH